MAAMVDSPLPFLCHIAVRCSFGVSCVLRPSCVRVLFIWTANFWNFAVAGSGGRGRAYVGFRDVYPSRAGNRGDDGDSFSDESTLGGETTDRVGRACRPTPPHLKAGGSLNLA